jgi:hypothetical protein
MSQKLLHDVEAYTAIDEVAGVAVAKIVQAKVIKASPLPNALPWGTE